MALVYPIALMRMLVLLSAVLLPVSVLAQDIDPGRRAFEAVCGRCHGGDGNGAEMGPPSSSGSAPATTGSWRR